MADDADEPNGREEQSHRWLGEVGLAYALAVVAFASLARSFGVTASRRGGCASRVPEDVQIMRIALMKASLKKGVKRKDLSRALARERSLYNSKSWKKVSDRCNLNRGA